MPRITYIEFDRTPHLVETEAGISLMQAARNSNIPGIDAECGGTCSCATCHIYIDPDWVALIGPARGIELEMLKFTSAYNEQSRLSCQINITGDMDGLVVRLPEIQG
jgi:2Fe-2S ferredoxin